MVNQPSEKWNLADNGGATSHAVCLPMFSPAAQAPTKRYRTIVADPPWHYDAPAYGYGADANYPTMTVEQVMGMPVGLWAMDNAHLYLWTTNTFLAEAHQIAKVWGFVPKTVLTWIKRRPTNDQWLGMGRYFRGTTEHVVFAVRGSLNTLRNDEPNFFYGARGGHSEKPAAFYDLVQRMSLGPYLDVFARKQRFNWDSWGDEAFNFETDGHWHDKF
jgi:N6-adenosine-specific RNA methylase IME4